MKRHHYDQRYFRERDILIPHLAKTVENLMIENNLKSVLDVGCGTGRLVQYLRKNRLDAEGCDIATEAVKAARKINPQSKIVIASASKLPFASSSFDLVCTISVIEHLKKTQIAKFLKEAKRVLKPNGFIFIVTPNFATPIRLLQGRRWFGYADKTHVTFFTSSRLKKLLINYGFNNFRAFHKIKYQKSVDWEFPGLFQHLPKFIKIFALFLLFSSHFSVIRNSIWLSAQKNG